MTLAIQSGVFWDVQPSQLLEVITVAGTWAVTAAPELTPDRDGYIWLPDQAFATAFAPDASPYGGSCPAGISSPRMIA
ncbi:hypothetical protein [Mycolicibacterium vinylchloridicum]|uniref:hypothetical protein n=1 Tax=Mycolicibacterium vinylchloridicum TaxID=2736928 RepID=UPI0015C99F9D|nr:hypothetical protein [Mycolicibacterium vinylchloridicum]